MRNEFDHNKSGSGHELVSHVVAVLHKVCSPFTGIWTSGL